MKKQDVTIKKTFYVYSVLHEMFKSFNDDSIEVLLAYMVIENQIRKGNLNTFDIKGNLAITQSAWLELSKMVEQFKGCLIGGVL